MDFSDNRVGNRVATEQNYVNQFGCRRSILGKKL